MESFTVCPQSNDSCLITSKVAEERDFPTRLRNVRLSFEPSAGTTIWHFEVITSKLNCLTKMTIIMFGGQKKNGWSLTLRCNNLQERQKRDWLIDGDLHSYSAFGNEALRFCGKVIWHQQLCNCVKICLFTAKKKKKKNPQIKCTLKKPHHTLAAASEDICHFPQLSKLGFNCGNSQQQQKDCRAMTASQ